jgi:hypothetical protein
MSLWCILGTAARLYPSKIFELHPSVEATVCDTCLDPALTLNTMTRDWKRYFSSTIGLWWADRPREQITITSVYKLQTVH